MPKFGDPIDLDMTLFDGEESLPVWVRATVKDAAGVEITGSPVLLAHWGKGQFSDDSLIFPDTRKVTYIIEVFEDALLTNPHPLHSNLIGLIKRSTELELLEDIDSNLDAIAAGALPGDLSGFVEDDGELIGFADDDGELIGSIEDNGELIGIVEVEELVGDLIDDGELIGFIEDCG